MIRFIKEGEHRLSSGDIFKVYQGVRMIICASGKYYWAVDPASGIVYTQANSIDELLSEYDNPKFIGRIEVEDESFPRCI